MGISIGRCERRRGDGVAGRETFGWGGLDDIGSREAGSTRFAGRVGVATRRVSGSGFEDGFAWFLTNVGQHVEGRSCMSGHCDVMERSPLSRNSPPLVGNSVDSRI